ncbi:hypothetical protein HWD35_10465 [Tsukamurella tyrosinosolvens]|nr:hypothetical protein [Tsukamurella tyrosinosolvens]
MSKNKPIRHGECMLRPVVEVTPATAQRSATVIVGHSETGHHHVLEAPGGHDLAYWTDDATHELFVQLAAPGKLVHKKDVNRHNDIEVAPGTYRVSRKTEYDPFEKVVREVWD